MTRRVRHARGDGDGYAIGPAIGPAIGFGHRVTASLFSALALAAAVSAASFGQVTVQLRGGALDREALSVTAGVQGLELRQVSPTKGETRELIAWDEVRGIVTTDATARDLDGGFLPMAEDLWRARVRIARGDSALARPLLAKHWPTLRAASGPTAQLAAEGLLRSALDAGELDAAIAPWIACFRLRGEGVRTRFNDLPPVLDESTGLLPELGPFMPSQLRPGLIAGLEAELTGDRAPGSGSPAARGIGPVAAEMAKVLRLGDGGAADVNATAASEPEPDAPKPTDPPALQALGAIRAIATAPDARARDRALGAFDKRFPEPPAFLSAWRLAAIGMSAARTARAVKPEARQAALLGAALEYLAVPASGFDKTGLVDAFALEEAERLAREALDAAAADALAALRMERLRESPFRTETPDSDRKSGPAGGPRPAGSRTTP